MFHLELFSSSIAQGANTFAQVNYFSSDAILPALVNGVQVSPDLPFVMGIAGVSTNLVHVRPQANSMLPYPYPTLSPNNRGASFENPPRFWDFTAAPIPLKPTEEFDIFATQNGAAAQSVYVAVLFSDARPAAIPVTFNPPGVASNPATPGRFTSVHWTASATLNVGAWTQVQPAFDQALYAGYYALVGARTYSATGLFFRMYPSMGDKWRPGGVCVNAYDQLDPANQRGFSSWAARPAGPWGTWLSFYQNVPPKVEIFATAADTAEEGWFDLVYLGPQVIQAI
jgi:hypothetical protein